MNDTVDILMATYNGEIYINQQVESILKQSYSNIRLIICDDLSTDSTPHLVSRYAKRYPERISIVTTEKKLGANQCFSFLLDHSKSKYIMFADQDDVWFENKVERTLKEMKKLESQYGKETPLLVHSDLAVADEKLNVLSHSFWRYSHISPSKTNLNRLLVQNVVTGCTVMINRAVVPVAFPFPETIVQHDWWLALVTTSLGHIKHIKEPLIYYRQHQTNSIGAKCYNFSTYWKRINQAETNYKLKNKNQALELKTRLYPQLNPNKKNILDNFLTISELNFIQLVFTCIRYRFCFHGISRNLGVFTKKIGQIIS